MTKKAKDKKSRGWCFTIGDYMEDEDESLAALMAIYEDNIEVKYLIIGFETAPRTNLKHLQCYIYFTNAVRFDTLKNLLPTAHIEAQQAKLNCEAYNYCMEDGNWIEFGERPRQGHRTDLDTIRHDLDNGVTIKEISKKNFNQWCFHRRAFKEYVELHAQVEQTRIIMYDDLYGLELAYKEFKPDLDKMYVELDYQNIPHEYYQKRYRYIYIPNTRYAPPEFYEWMRDKIFQIYSKDGPK